MSTSSLWKPVAPPSDQRPNLEAARPPWRLRHIHIAKPTTSESRTVVDGGPAARFASTLQSMLEEATVLT